MSRDVDQMEGIIRTYNRQGWYPVPWAHHPKPIKDALRRFGLRPMIKECFRNCQAFMFRNMLEGETLDLVYCEGWVQDLIPLEHAWLEYEGKLLDLTLRPDGGKHTILAYNTYGAKQVMAGMRRGWFGPLDPEAMANGSPWAEGFRRLAAHVEGAVGNG